MKRSLAHALGRALDVTLGDRCPHGCGQRIYPRDLARHLHIEHGGDIPDLIVTAVQDTDVARAYLARHRNDHRRTDR